MASWKIYKIQQIRHFLFLEVIHFLILVIYIMNQSIESIKYTRYFGSDYC